jgi:formylmethanofuran dehydrogenase subunit E
MKNLDILLEKAKNFHGDVCAGIAIGTRMAIVGFRELDMNPLERNRDLVVFVEADRCLADALQAISGCSLGKRTLKFRDHGKFGATFLDLSTNKAVRISSLNKPRKDMSPKELANLADEILKTPDEELFKIQKVQVNLPEEDLPGPPSYRTTCEKCGEGIMDHREVIVDGEILCKSCTEGSYYSIIDG